MDNKKATSIQNDIKALAEMIRKDEKIFHPNKWYYYSLMMLPIAISCGLTALAIAAPTGSTTFGDWFGYTSFVIFSIILTRWLSKPLNKKLYATRVNACGIMSLHNGIRFWCSWDNVLSIRATYSESEDGVQQINSIMLKINDSDKNYITIPKSYGISDYSMLILIQRYHRRHKKIDQTVFKKVEKLVRKDPPEMYLKKSWGRAAKP